MEPSRVLHAENVSRSYGEGERTVHALREVTLSLARGQLVGLAGPSGSGKSTLLNILGLADRPNRGALTFEGKLVDFSDPEALRLIRRQRIGYVFQYFNLLPSLTAVENVEISLLLNGMDFSEARRRALSSLAALGLEQRARHLPQELSGGEMQRVAICRAIVHDPALVLADEPTGNLDSRSGELVIETLRSLASAGKAVLMATHNEHALESCSRVLRLHDGMLSSHQETAWNP